MSNFFMCDGCVFKKDEHGTLCNLPQFPIVAADRSHRYEYVTKNGRGTQHATPKEACVQFKRISDLD